MVSKISSFISLAIILMIIGIGAEPSSEISEADVKAGLALLEKTVCGNVDLDAEKGIDDVNISNYPWTALIIYMDRDEKKPLCGGSLIHERYVLTAAHCARVHGESLKLVSVRLGGFNVDTQICDKSKKCGPRVQEIDVEKVIHHKDYNGRKLSNDIGLVRLAKNAEISTNVKPICLPIKPVSTPTDFSEMIMLTAGWSVFENRRNSKNNPGILEMAAISVKPIEYCKEHFDKLPLNKNEICGVGNTCKGDSGGPLFNRSKDGDMLYTQYGISSGGDILCDSNSTGVFVNVAEYLPWIASNLKES
ncbi:serine protease grass-like [Episyrphus balteatus]|uniref:serine protease grass-like n=1 Tax=Episyrphus balteatus TaxID=286459 RepID=UPI0024866C3D|nr:serine protease grass-like [Episyrphus balteatus]